MFDLAFPWALVLLPLPLLIGWLLPRVADVVPVSLAVPFYDALASSISQKKHDVLNIKPLYYLALIWICLVLAAAGPRWVGAPIPLSRDGHNLMLVLDLSGSMELDDMELHGRPATRLSVVKSAAKQFVAKRSGDRIGLILFGSRAYLQTPLTYDHHNVLQRLDEAIVGLAGNTTSIGDALGLAVKRLQHAAAKSRVIILLTDGANNSGVLTPMKAAQLALMDQIKIYTIGLGSERASRRFGNLFYGMNPSADLDETTLKKLAKKTGGRYFYATDPKSLNEIYQMINQLETVQQEESTIRPQQEYYPWLLALACMLWFGAALNQSSLFRRNVSSRINL